MGYGASGEDAEAPCRLVKYQNVQQSNWPIEL